jgi:hypothetical protein
MQNLPKDGPVAETVSFWFAGDHNLTMSPTGRAIVRFSMPPARRPPGSTPLTSQTTAGGELALAACAAHRCSALSTERPAAGPGRPPRSAELRRVAGRAGVRRRFAPHQLRNAHALELAREGVPLNIIQRQLGHLNLGTTSIYLQGINPEEIITAVRTRRAPMMSASAGLKL